MPFSPLCKARKAGSDRLLFLTTTNGLPLRANSCVGGPHAPWKSRRNSNLKASPQSRGGCLTRVSQAPHTTPTATVQGPYRNPPHRKEVIELGSANWLLVGLAAAAVVAIGSLFLITDPGQTFETTGSTSYLGFGAGVFGEPVGSTPCAASCEEAVGCSDADEASCPGCSNDCAEASGACSGDGTGACRNLAQSSSYDGSGRGLGRNSSRCSDAVETRQPPTGQPCSGTCTGGCS